MVREVEPCSDTTQKGAAYHVHHPVEAQDVQNRRGWNLKLEH